MKKYVILLAVVIFSACKSKTAKEYSKVTDNPEFIHNAYEKLTDVIIHDIFSPPVASRIYSYANLAGYEALVSGEKDMSSMVSRVKDFRQETTFGLWLKQIVIHKAINCLRKRKVIFEDIAEVDIEEVIDLNYADDIAEINFKVETVKEAMMLLPEGYRLVLSLYLLEGYDHEEISQILKISVNTSRTQFLRAKRKLIEILKLKGIER